MSAPSDTVALPGWDALTRRSVELCRRDRARWARCMDRADALEAQGLDGRTALLRALEETGA